VEHAHACEFTQDPRCVGDLRDFEITMVRKDGTPLEVSLSATGDRDEGGTVFRRRCVARDVMLRRQAERELVEASPVRERFLALVSHELRTPYTPCAQPPRFCRIQRPMTRGASDRSTC